MNKNHEIAQYPVGSTFHVKALRQMAAEAPLIWEGLIFLAHEEGDDDPTFRLQDNDFFMPSYTALFDVQEYTPLFIPWREGDRIVIQREHYAGPLSTAEPKLSTIHGTVAKGTMAQQLLAGPHTTYVRVDGHDPKVYLYPEGFASLSLKPEPPTPDALIVDNAEGAHA